MLQYFDFGWKKILPILYDDYLSNTEILNAIISRFNEFIKTLNEQEAQLNEHLRDYESLKKEVSEVEKDITSLQLDLMNMVDQINDLLNEFNELKDDFNTMSENVSKLVQRMLDDFEIKIDAKLRIIKLEIQNLENRLNLKILKVDNKVESNNRALLKVISNNYSSLVRYVNRKLGELNFNVMVINPITGQKETLQQVLNHMVEWFSKSLSAFEYDNLYLSAKQYDFLGLTAWQYDMYGISPNQLSEIYDYSMDECCKQFDAFGNLRKGVVSSLIQMFGYGVDATMSNFNLTCAEYDDISGESRAVELDKEGYFVLSNHKPAHIEPVVHLVSDLVTVDSAGESEVSFILTLPVDRVYNIPTHELLTDRSLDVLHIDFNPEVLFEDKDGYARDTMVNVEFNIYNVKTQLVEGGIAVNATIWNNSTALYDKVVGEDDVPVTEQMVLPMVLDPTGFTSF